MKKDQLVSTILFIILYLSVFVTNSCSQKNNHASTVPVPKVISFNPDSTNYQELLSMDKDSVIFSSGVVTLLKNKMGEKHNSKSFEEIIITLEGEGLVKITNGRTLKVSYGKVAWIPPNTEHQAVNAGTSIFKYIYVAVKKQK